MTLSPLTPELARRGNIPASVRGVIITAVDPNSTAAEEGLRPGYVVLSVNQQAVTSPADFAAAVETARRARRTSVLLLVRLPNGTEAFVGVDLPRQ